MRLRNSLIIFSVLILGIIPFASAVGIGIGIGTNVTITNSAPLVCMNPSERIFDQLGTVTRANNYAFEGESIQWEVLVRDKDGILDINEVGVTIIPNGTTSSLLKVNCVALEQQPTGVISWCNDGANPITFSQTTDKLYKCILTITPRSSMHGKYWVQAEARDKANHSSTFDEHEFWFLNPTLAVTASDNIRFATLTPGSRGYSNTIAVKNNAEQDSGVKLDMKISGTDFYDPGSGASTICPTSNVLSLSRFAYYATLGAYSTNTNTGHDAEGYDTIPYTTITRARIIDAQPYLNEGASLSLTFRLDLPQPCMSSPSGFSNGSIDIWGEAV